LDIGNFIEGKYKKIAGDVNEEYIGLYQISNPKLRTIFSTLHGRFVSLFEAMNTRLPTGNNSNHFWAEPSRVLLETIDIAEALQKVLANTEFAFYIEEYYQRVIDECKKFLKSTLGSAIPPRMGSIDIYYTTPIFIPKDSTIVSNPEAQKTYELKLIGEGSYAQVFKYKDEYYQKTFALKRAKKELNGKELERFKREFEQIKNLKSPYIVEVYCYNNLSNEYVMEYMDYSLEDYINRNNSKLERTERKNIGLQILKAFTYLQTKNLLHRDVSPKNVLIKKYDDTVVVKISDFGLVKIPDSNLTSVSTEFKGFFNDPGLLVDGFSSYSILHETFALTRLLLFVMTGKTNIDKITDQCLKALILKGLNQDKANRFQMFR
jgi:serine/threonine-protein kinase